jgi:hypothetical protein
MGHLMGIGKAVEAISGLTEELRKFLAIIIGPAAEELGELGADKVRFLRFKNWIRTAEAAQELLNKQGISPSTVNLKILAPIMEGSSLEEEDENLTSKWTGLLASAAAGKAIRASYPKILMELEPNEARLLDLLYQIELNTQGVSEITDELKEKLNVENLRKNAGLTEEELSLCIDNLKRLELCYEVGSRLGDGILPPYPRTMIAISSLGFNFVEACSSPSHLRNSGATRVQLMTGFELDIEINGGKF